VSQEHPIFLPRYLVVSLPALALLLGASVSAVRPPLLGVALAGALLIAASTSLYHWYRRPPIENWQKASAYLLAKAKPEDEVVYQMSWAVPAITYYAQRSPGRVPLQFGPHDDALPQDLRRQVWLVLYQHAGAGGARLRTRLRAHGLRRVAARDFGGDLRLELF